MKTKKIELITIFLFACNKQKSQDEAVSKGLVPSINYNIFAP
jgi:hypothetical protein